MSTPIRVRFAPSPTGLLHLGNLRAALFNYLFARRSGGTFILRIEDTDRERFVPEALDNIFDALSWYGLHWDEGPIREGGKLGSRGTYGPYVQSERLDIYHRHAETLISSNAAYHCFCSPDRLEKVRKDHMRAKKPPRYDRHCRNLSPEERKQKLDARAPYVIRLAVPEQGSITLTDLVRGEVTFDLSTIDDQVLLKSDGYPTYHLANVVDDHLMDISHVIRAEEWLPSTPKHLLLFKAFGWDAPQYAHLSMILGNDRSKLSKRHGAEPALTYRDRGFLPSAVINYIAFLGWNPGGEREVFSLADLEKEFSLEKVNKAPAIFDIQKLEWMNGLHIRTMKPVDLIPIVRKMSPMHDISDEELARVLSVVQERITKITDIEEWGMFYFKQSMEYAQDEIARARRRPGEHATMSQEDFDRAVFALNDFSLKLLERIPESQWVATGLKEAFFTELKTSSTPTKSVLPYLRFVISGSDTSPDVFAMMWVLGKTRTIERVQQALRVLTT